MLEGWRFRTEAEKAARELEELSDEVSAGITVVHIGTHVPGINIPRLTPLTNQVEKYLSGPTILYDVDPATRKVVKNRIVAAKPRLGRFIELDRLGFNNLLALHFVLQNNTRLLGGSSELIDILLGVTNLIPRSAAEYDLSDDQEKVGLTQEIASGLLTAHMLLKKNEASLKR